MVLSSGVVIGVICRFVFLFLLVVVLGGLLFSSSLVRVCVL